MWGPNDHLATLFIDFYYVVKKRCECISSSTSKRIQPESKFFEIFLFHEHRISETKEAISFFNRMMIGG